MDPHSSRQKNHPEIIPRTTGRGPATFFIFLACYVAFVLVNVFAPEVESHSSAEFNNLLINFGGLNVAIVTGLLLMFAGVLLSLLFLSHPGESTP